MGKVVKGRAADVANLNFHRRQEYNDGILGRVVLILALRCIVHDEEVLLRTVRPRVDVVVGGSDGGRE
jgi:hypothetical protein